MTRPLAEIVAEGRRQATNFGTVILPRKDALRIGDAVEKAIALFATLDRVAPGWREETCTVGGDDVNRAWSELERALGLGPDALAAPAPEGEGSNG